MNKYQQYKNIYNEMNDMIEAQNHINQLTSIYNSKDSLISRYNDQHNQIMYEYYKYELAKLQPMIINDIADEVYQRVINNIEVKLKSDSTLLKKSLDDAISSRIKSISK